MLHESQGERCEYQDDTYIHHQPFRELVSKKQDVFADYYDYQQHNYGCDNV